MRCRDCKKEFSPNPCWRHSWGICAKCRIVNKRRIKSRYKKSTKGEEAELRWRKNPIKKKIDKRYRSTEKAKIKAVERMERYRAKHPQVKIEEKRLGKIYMSRTQGKMRKWWKEKSKNGCIKCGSFKLLGIDHIIPRSKGGGDEKENLQALCAKCNGEKGVKTIDYADNL